MREYLDMNRYSDQVKQMAMQFYGLKVRFFFASSSSSSSSCDQGILAVLLA